MNGQQIDRDRLKKLADEYDDSTIDGGPDAAAGAIRQLLEALAQAEAALQQIPGYTTPEHFRRAVEKLIAEKLRAEACIQAVRDVLAHHPYGGPDQEAAIRRALDGDQ